MTGHSKRKDRKKKS